MSKIQDINLNVFELPQINLNGFIKSISKLQKKADKLGVGRIQVVFSEPYIKVISNGLFKSKVPHVQVTITGEAPVISGWLFVARFDFSNEFGVLIKKVAKDETIPSRYLIDDGDPKLCEHCNKRRTRRRAFIVKNVKSGEWKQVGSSCVKDFTGHVTPEKLARYWGYIADIDGIGDDWSLDDDGGYCGPRSRMEFGELLLGEYLTRVACVSRMEGFISKAKANHDDFAISTSQIAVNWMYARKKEEMKPYRHFEVLAEDAVLAQEAIKWAEGISDKEAYNNEFIMNLRNIARAGTVPIYHVGHAGYMVQAYLKAVGRIEEQEKRAEGSEYYPAEVKDRVEIEGTKLTFHTTFDTKYGITHLYKFNKDGYTFVWFASSGQGLVPGDVVSFKATIKKFEEYQGIKQTIITRGKILKEELSNA